jgi:hypothetical protein
MSVDRRSDWCNVELDERARGAIASCCDPTRGHAFPDELASVSAAHDPATERPPARTRMSTSGGRARSASIMAPTRMLFRVSASLTPDRKVGVFLDTQEDGALTTVVGLGGLSHKMLGLSDRWRAHRGTSLRDPRGLLYRPGALRWTMPRKALAPNKDPLANTYELPRR